MEVDGGGGLLVCVNIHQKDSGGVHIAPADAAVLHVQRTAHLLAHRLHHRRFHLIRNGIQGLLGSLCHKPGQGEQAAHPCQETRTQPPEASGGFFVRRSRLAGVFQPLPQPESQKEHHQGEHPRKVQWDCHKGTGQGQGRPGQKQGPVKIQHNLHQKQQHCHPQHEKGHGGGHIAGDVPSEAPQNPGQLSLQVLASQQVPEASHEENSHGGQGGPSAWEAVQPPQKGKEPHPQPQTGGNVPGEYPHLLQNLCKGVLADEQQQKVQPGGLFFYLPAHGISLQSIGIFSSFS